MKTSLFILTTNYKKEKKILLLSPISSLSKLKQNVAKFLSIQLRSGMAAIQSESSGPRSHTLIQGSPSPGPWPGKVPVRDQATGQIVSGGHESKAVTCIPCITAWAPPPLRSGWHNKCNAFESSQNCPHAPFPRSTEKWSSIKPVPGAKKARSLLLYVPVNEWQGCVSELGQSLKLRTPKSNPTGIRDYKKDIRVM